MPANASGVQTVPPGSGRLRCWVEFAILGLGLPAAIWAASSVITFSIPAASHGSVGQRFLLGIIGPVVAEWAFVVGLRLALRGRWRSFRDLGVWRLGTWPAWTVALGVAAIAIRSNLRFFPRMHIPVSYAFFPHGIHLVAALAFGITAGFCEEVLFRAFLMTEFAQAGYNKTIQILIPGLAFGLSHTSPGYLKYGFLVWLGIWVPTAFLGMIWGVAYLLGRRSLVPAVVAHFLNDATALPWLAFFMMTAR